MNTLVYKPFKKKIINWEIVPEATVKADNGRKMLLVNIGDQQIVNTDTGEIIDTSPVSEYIYEDILHAIFSREEYTSRLCLGCTPQLIVTYENRLVMHNEEVSLEVEKVIEVIKKADRHNISEVLVNSQLNYETKVPISKEYRDVIKRINEECDEFYSPDFIGLVMREFFFEQEREYTDYSDELHYMSKVELKEELGRVLNEGNGEKLNQIKDELMYSFLMGDIIANPKIMT